MNPKPLAPVVTGDGRSGLVVDCPEHALPMGVILDEYRSRRREELEKYLPEVFQDNKNCTWSEVRKKLAERNAKYRALTVCKANPNSLPSDIDELEKACRRADKPFKELLHKMDGSALCLSGGGIRSASFGLGILEGLSRFSNGTLNAKQKHDCDKGLLQNLDYLSTVSGGGYIGSWFTAWIFRRRMAVIQRAQFNRDEAIKKRDQARAYKAKITACPTLLARAASLLNIQKTNVAQKAELELSVLVKDAETVVADAEDQFKEATSATWKLSYSQVLKALAGAGEFTSGDPAPQPVRHLRDYTSYLAPSMGLSLDSWDLVAIVFRNLLVNWAMLVPLLLALVTLPQISDCVSREFGSINGATSNYYWLPVFALFVVAALFAGSKLPSHRRTVTKGPRPRWVVIGFALPILAGNWIVVQLWRANSNHVGSLTQLRYVFTIAEIGFFLLAVLLFSSYRRRLLGTKRESLVSGARGILRIVLMQIAALVCAGITAVFLGLLTAYVFPVLIKTHSAMGGFVADDRLFTIFALPLITLVPIISASLFSGFLGIFEQEEDREWFSRAGGMVLAVITVWVFAHAVALYATESLKGIFVMTGLILGGVGSGLGWSGATSAGPRPVKASQIGKLGSFLKKHNFVVPSTCALGLLLLALGAAGSEHVFTGKLAGKPQETLGTHLAILTFAIVLALLLNWAINVNLFSLHGMYRMRLMRAFLGASNTQRKPDAFTQFDPRDTPAETALPCAPGTPLHVINTTLNLVGTKNLAWRQRKAESFTFSPLYSGAWRLAYVPTSDYAGTEGVSLATAMAISGAAFNPNMGYHSSPLVTLLMTFFNLRLGWWLPNPAREEGTRNPTEFLRKTGPTIALEPLIREGFGMTDEAYRWIELTDGGHFENLGLYEMVLRRCHHIVVIDAGADPKCQFEDLGNALRKIEIDLGIPIRFNDGIKMKAGAQRDNRYCAVAKIDYACVDAEDCMSAEDRKSLAGTLIYIKAGITGAEPPDIKQYALTHSDFPHETTANQFFNESQFESYRHLGAYEVETIVREGLLNRSKCLGKHGPGEDERSVESALGSDFDSLATFADYYISC